MLSKFKANIEKLVGGKVDDELPSAVKMAMKDVFANNLAMGQDVKAEYFQVVTARCVKLIRDTDKPVGISQPSMICPDCGYRLIPDSGCSFCPNCGWSQCK